MTTIVILLWGFGAVLVISAIETDPKTGQSVSIIQTVKDIWNDVPPNFSQSTAPDTSGATSNAPVPTANFGATVGANQTQSFPAGVPPNVAPNSGYGVAGIQQSAQYAQQMQGMG